MAKRHFWLCFLIWLFSDVLHTFIPKFSLSSLIGITTCVPSKSIPEITESSFLYWEFAGRKWWHFSPFTYCLYHHLQCFIFSSFHHQFTPNAWRYIAWCFNHKHVWLQFALDHQIVDCLTESILLKACLPSPSGIQVGTPVSYHTSTISKVVTASLVVHLQVLFLNMSIRGLWSVSTISHGIFYIHKPGQRSLFQVVHIIFLQLS